MKEEEGGGGEDMARKSFETFDGKIVINSTFFALFPQPPISYYSSLSCLLDHYVEKSLPCRGCKGWLNQESPELYIYIYIYTSFQVETRIKIGREEFRGVEDRGKNFRDTQDRTKGWLFRFFARFALVFVAVKLNYLVKKVTYTEIS